MQGRKMSRFDGDRKDAYGLRSRSAERSIAYSSYSPVMEG